MTDRYCLRYGGLQDGFEGEPAGQEPAAIFHLTADGTLREVSELPPLQEGAGFVMYAGDFYVEPLEIQVEFLKADNARKWLEALVLRHTDRVHGIGDDLWVLAGIEEVSI